MAEQDISSWSNRRNSMPSYLSSSKSPLKAEAKAKPKGSKRQRPIDPPEMNYGPNQKLAKLSYADLLHLHNEYEWQIESAKTMTGCSGHTYSGANVIKFKLAQWQARINSISQPKK